MVRSESLRVDSGVRTHRIFRPSDLIHGEVLGKGFFGQAVKVPVTIFIICIIFSLQPTFSVCLFMAMADFVVSSIILIGDITDLLLSR